MKAYLRLVVTGALISAILFLMDQTYRLLSGFSTAFQGNMLLSYGYYALYGIPLTFVNAYLVKYIREYYAKRQRGYNFP